MKTQPIPQGITFEEMGIAAELPGLQRAIDCLQSRQHDLHNRLIEIRAERNGVAVNGRNGDFSGELNAKGQPLKSGFWAALTPEQRSAEMKKRIATRRATLGAAEAEAAMAARRKRISKRQKAYWASLSPAAKKAKVAALVAARHRKMEANV